jgi:hypothetical protein
MGLLKTILIIRYLPILIIGGGFLFSTILFVGAGTVVFVLQGIQRVEHGQSFFPPERPRKPQKPTGLSIFMHHALTSPAGRNAARKHLLIPDPAYSRKRAPVPAE